MKILSKIFVLGFMMVIFVTSSFAQVSTNASASAQILTPITIAKRVDMNLGNLAVNASSGAIVLTPASTWTASGGVTFLNGNSGTMIVGYFEVTGLADATYFITLPAIPTIINYAGNNMTVEAWSSDPTPTGTLTDGIETVNVDARLDVPGSSPAGLNISTIPF